jgi:hypothetical protein
MAVSYDKKTDYTAEINKAVASGDYRLAGQLEDQRNAKIAGEGLSYQQTHDYTGNNDSTDYASVIRNQMNSGADAADVADSLYSRNNKISTAKNLSQYANDSVTQAALEYIRSGLAKKGNNFQYGSAPTYTGQYDDQISGLVDKILNGTFTDYLAGDEYAALKGKYTAAGQKAMDDTVGRVSARTGGLASSYATTAASETYDDYMSKLEDAAREMYGDEVSGLYNKESLLSSLDSSDYAKYEDQLAQYNTDRNFAYNQSRDNVSDSQYSEQLKYSTAQDDYNKAADKAATLAAAGDFSGYKALGYTDAEIAAMKAAYIANNTPKTSGSTGSTGSKKSSGKRKKSEETYNDRLNDIAAANTGTDSSTYTAVSREMLNQRRSGTTSDDMSNYLEALIKKGTITEAQAYQLAKQYGLLTNAELGL